MSPEWTLLDGRESSPDRYHPDVLYVARFGIEVGYIRRDGEEYRAVLTGPEQDLFGLLPRAPVDLGTFADRNDAAEAVRTAHLAADYRPTT